MWLRQMQQAIDYLQHELAGVRTGRANPGLIENVPVDAHGEHVPLKAVAAVTVRNPQTLGVSVFDPTVGRPGTLLVDWRWC
jgi:ribosome recycling factor